MKGSRFSSWASASGFISQLYSRSRSTTTFAAEPGKGYDAKAAEWREKLEELGTQAQRHEGTEGDGKTSKSQNVETSNSDESKTSKSSNPETPKP
jgi:hypothetical protein